MEKGTRRSALGKGLDALIPDLKIKKERIEIEIESIKPNPYQPRTNFDLERLKELVASIKQKGVVQPVIVRAKDGGYELVAGERRLRAAKEAGLSKIPVVIKDVTDSEMLEISLIENIQRQELNPIEEAEAYQQLVSRFGLTQEDLAKRVGRDRSSVANSLRLLRLPPEVQDLLRKGDLSAGHARAILSLEDSVQQIESAERVVKYGLSVRKTESLVNRIKGGGRKYITSRKDPSIKACEEELMRALGVKVRIEQGRKKGEIIIEYYSQEDLDRIIGVLLG